MPAPPDSEFLTNLSFPLPYRVLFLIGLGILAWATNLHGLNSCGVDVLGPMNLRAEANFSKPSIPTFHPAFNHLKMGPLYQATYRLFLSYASICISSWVLFRVMTHGDPSLMDKYGYIPVVTAIAIIFLLLCPYDILVRSEREKFTSAVRRCLFPGPVYFSDVILADIGTSFAKVFGDAWQSIWMLKPGNSMLMPPVRDNWLRWILPTMMSVPFFLRFRQCLVEYNSPANESRKPFYNALKYATSFPVIFLSAAQRLVAADAMKDQAPTFKASEHPLFRLWLLAAVINSLFSFWWDVTYDWGLDLLKCEAPQNRDRYLLHPQSLNRQRSGTPSRDESPSPSPQTESHAPKNMDMFKRRYRQSCRGLRPVLLYPRAIYPVLVFLNLLLRMTWSIKLSTHVQSPRDGSFAFFWLEVAELVRRWLWVFIRVEWEAIRIGEDKTATPLLDDHSGDEGDYEMTSTTDLAY